MALDLVRNGHHRTLDNLQRNLDGRACAGLGQANIDMASANSLHLPRGQTMARNIDDVIRA